MLTYFNINYEFSRETVLQRISDAVALNAPACYVCVADGNILQMVHRDKEYHKVVNGAMFSICDSSWVPLFLKRIYGMKVQQYCGSQLFKDVVSEGKYKMYFLGSSQTILKPLREELSSKYDSRIASMTFEELPFLSVDKFDYHGIAERINADAPDIIWVSLGAPKQEIFMCRLKPYLKRGVMIAVGAVFKFYSGVSEKRAPEWMVKSHIEFIYRIFQDPKKQVLRCRDIVVCLPQILMEEKRMNQEMKVGCGSSQFENKREEQSN